MDTPFFLTYDNGLFIWCGTYENRHLPKEAGFSWTSHMNAYPGCWTTVDYSRAWQLYEYADSRAQKALHRRPGAYNVMRRRQQEREGKP